MSVPGSQGVGSISESFRTREKVQRLKQGPSPSREAPTHSRPCSCLGNLHSL